MALDGNQLGSDVFADLKEAGHIKSDAPGDAEEVWQIIMTRVVSHFENYGEVETTDTNGDTGTGTIT